MLGLSRLALTVAAVAALDLPAAAVDPALLVAPGAFSEACSAALTRTYRSAKFVAAGQRVLLDARGVGRATGAACDAAMSPCNTTYGPARCCSADAASVWLRYIPDLAALISAGAAAAASPSAPGGLLWLTVSETMRFGAKALVKQTLAGITYWFAPSECVNAADRGNYLKLAEAGCNNATTTLECSMRFGFSHEGSAE